MRLIKSALATFLVFGLCLAPTRSFANDLSVFLRSCGYGAAAGAVLGLGLVALSENPGNQLNTIARGASYGLYAGIGFGLYAVSDSRNGSSDLAQQNPQQIWFSPLQSEKKISGAMIHWQASVF